jgi:hypothetical protein
MYIQGKLLNKKAKMILSVLNKNNKTMIKY